MGESVAALARNGSNPFPRQTEIAGPHQELRDWKTRPRYHNCLEQFALEFDLFPQRRVFTVSELNGAIRALLDREFGEVWVSGEISGLKLAASGHYYFTLKERESILKCVAYRSSHRDRKSVV